MYYLALSNVSSVNKKYSIKKGQTISKVAFDKLSDRHKVHFKGVSTPNDVTPKELDELTGKENKPAPSTVGKSEVKEQTTQKSETKKQPAPSESGKPEAKK